MQPSQSGLLQMRLGSGTLRWEGPPAFMGGPNLIIGVLKEEKTFLDVIRERGGDRRLAREISHCCI